MVISHGRLWTSSKSRPIVGSALARMVLSSDPRKRGSSTPKTISRVSLWVRGVAPAASAPASAGARRSSERIADESAVVDNERIGPASWVDPGCRPKQIAASFDDLVGARQQRRGNLEVEFLCGLKIDDELDGRL